MEGHRHAVTGCRAHAWVLRSDPDVPVHPEPVRHIVPAAMAAEAHRADERTSSKYSGAVSELRMPSLSRRLPRGVRTAS